MSVSKRLRFEAFKRDKFTCQYCGQRPPDVMLEADHIIPKAEGGPDDLTNLTTSCFACNRGKADKSLGDVAPALDELEQLAAIQEMLERKRDLQAQVVVGAQLRQAEDVAIEIIQNLWLDATGAEQAFEGESVRVFLNRGLTVEDLRQAANRTGFWGEHHLPIPDGKMLWKYFCGICWSWIREST